MNDDTSDDIIIQALDDAYQDGMDVISLSSGGPAFSGPLDAGAVAETDPESPATFVAQAVETLSGKGVVIVYCRRKRGERRRQHQTSGI